MNYREFQRQIGKSGLTIKKFAQLMRMNRASISNLAKRSSVPNHLAVISTLMGMLSDKQVSFIDTIDSLDLEPMSPRGKGFPKSNGVDD
jgi:hypothetical protein